VNPAQRLKAPLFALFGASLALTVALLFYVESGNYKKLQALSERVAGFDRQRLQQDFAEKALDVVAPLARQAEDSGLDLDAQVKALAEDGVVKALFAKGRL